jgi:hypothetical protein
MLGDFMIRRYFFQAFDQYVALMMQISLILLPQDEKKIGNLILQKKY